MNRLNAAIVALTTGVLTACAPSGSGQAGGHGSTAVDQANLCEVKGWQHDVVKAACKAGQKVVFLPESWGNEQLPVLFAAVNCDLRYSVAMTNGGVTCIFSPITVEQASPPEQSGTSAEPQP